MNAAIINSICTTIADYRAGSIPPRTPDDIIRWAKQFDAAIRDPLLAELDHVLKETYFSKQRVKEFLTFLSKNVELAGANPCEFWKHVRLLDIQQRGNSQRDMLALFQECLTASCGKPGTVASTGSDTFVYLDDVIFTGNHVRRDLEAWVRDEAPPKAKVHVIVVAIYAGSWYARKQLQAAIQKSGKTIDITWWWAHDLEDRRNSIDESDVLRPRALPDDAGVEAYANALKYPVTLRTADSRGKAEIFSSEAGRNVMEQAMLLAGVRIRGMCPNLPNSQRPLGYTSLECLGFGSTVVTYRNCPNNCPLAFWVAEPWVPLFPRKINEQKFDWGF